jgi:hypothetical protein
LVIKVFTCDGRHGLGAAVAELETELVALETAKPNTSEKPQRVGGGGGGRQRVKARQKSQSTKEPQHTPRLEWLKQEGIDLTNEVAIVHDVVEPISVIADHLMIW